VRHITAYTAETERIGAVAAEALAEIHSQAGYHFDPRVAAAFATIDRRVLSEPAADAVSRAA